MVCMLYYDTHIYEDEVESVVCRVLVVINSSVTAQYVRVGRVS